jgi:hypothetical protein
MQATRRWLAVMGTVASGAGAIANVMLVFRAKGAIAPGRKCSRRWESRTTWASESLGGSGGATSYDRLVAFGWGEQAFSAA